MSEFDFDDVDTVVQLEHPIREDDIEEEHDDPQMREYYERMREYYERMAAVRMPEGMTLCIVHGTEGPRHDPYGWTEYRVCMPDGVSAVYRQSEFTERLEVTYPELGKVTFSAPWSEPPMEAMFKDIVGYGLEQLMWWDSERWEQAMAELEAAGWDASP